MSVLSRSFFNLSVIGAPLSEVMGAFEVEPPQKVAAQPTSFVLPEQPYSSNDSRWPMILWSPRCVSGITAFMPHVSSGDYFVTHYAYSKFNMPVVSVRSTTQDVEWPINEFSCYEHGKLKRFVRAMRDSPGWDFFEQGPALSFEITEQYRKRRIRDRLTRDDITTYLERWAAPVRKPEFWLPSSTCFTFVPTLGMGA